MMEGNGFRTKYRRTGDKRASASAVRADELLPLAPGTGD
jgi:hypothetical protein